MKESKYLDFVETPRWNWEGEGTERKTKIFEVLSKLRRTVLGEIKWYAQWRQYCFYPAPNCVFNPGCLQDIAGFIGELMEERSKDELRRFCYSCYGEI